MNWLFLFLNRTRYIPCRGLGAESASPALACVMDRVRLARWAGLAHGNRSPPSPACGKATGRRDARRLSWLLNVGMRVAIARLRRRKFDFNNSDH